MFRPPKGHRWRFSGPIRARSLSSSRQDEIGASLGLLSRWGRLSCATFRFPRGSQLVEVRRSRWVLVVEVHQIDLLLRHAFQGERRKAIPREEARIICFERGPQLAAHPLAFNEHLV